MLIYYISEEVKGPGALQKKIDVDRRVMNKQLDELVKDGFVDKFSFDTKIPKVEYQLTALGVSLLPLIISLEKWGENNDEDFPLRGVIKCWCGQRMTAGWSKGIKRNSWGE